MNLAQHLPTPAVSPATVRRRMIGIAAGGFATNLAFVLIMTFLPLYCTQRLGLSPDQYARVLTVRNFGITLGVLVLGVVSDRVGSRRMTLRCLVLAGLCYAAVGLVPYAGLVVLVAPLSALLSTAFVNLAHLTQIADPLRPGRANTWYRAVGISAALVGPVSALPLLTHAPWVFAGVGTLMVAAAAVLRLYPLEEPLPAFRGVGGEVRAMGRMYAGALSDRPLMAFINLSLIFVCLNMAVGTFIAIRLSDQLGMSPAAFGACSAAGAGLSLALVLGSGPLLDRVSAKYVLIATQLLCAACLIGMGLSRAAWSTATIYIAHAAVSAIASAPMSMWIAGESRRVGLTTGFSVQKILNALYAAAATYAFSLAIPRIDIPGLFIAAGLLAIPVIATMSLLRKPESPVPSPQPEAEHQ